MFFSTTQKDSVRKNRKQKLFALEIREKTSSNLLIYYQLIILSINTPVSLKSIKLYTLKFESGIPSSGDPENIKEIFFKTSKLLILLSQHHTVMVIARGVTYKALAKLIQNALYANVNNFIVYML